jgi:hypothetical protein
MCETVCRGARNKNGEGKISFSLYQKNSKRKKKVNRESYYAFSLKISPRSGSAPFVVVFFFFALSVTLMAGKFICTRLRRTVRSPPSASLAPRCELFVSQRAESLRLPIRFTLSTSATTFHHKTLRSRSPLGRKY